MKLFYLLLFLLGIGAIPVLAVGPKIVGKSGAQIGGLSTANNPGLILGFQQYRGGLIADSPEVVITSGCTSVYDAVFIPYKISNGNWRLKFNFGCNVTLALSGSIIIDGMVTSAFRQAYTAATWTGDFQSRQTWIEQSTGNFTWKFTGSINRIAVSGDVELKSKPTWAN